MTLNIEFKFINYKFQRCKYKSLITLKASNFKNSVSELIISTKSQKNANFRGVNCAKALIYKH